MELSEYKNPSDVNLYVTPKPFQLGYQPKLDGLRGIAILAVMAFNGHSVLIQGGFVGVDIFFVLSGFLITFLLVQTHLREGSLDLRHFYVRRVLRLLPALFVLILACFLYALLFQSETKSATTFKGVLYTLLYVNNWVQVFQPGLGALSHAWSLSVEEQFYILWPLLLFALLKIKKKIWVLGILVSLILISLGVSVWSWHVKASLPRMYFSSDIRAHELLIGCLTALVLFWGIVDRKPSTKQTLKIASSISIVGILLSFFLVRYNTALVYNGGFTVVCICTAVWILDILLFPSSFSGWLELRPLVWIGRISYGLYLWHFPIFESARQLFEGRMSPVLYQVIAIVVTFLVATTSYYLLEMPFLRLGQGFKTKDPVVHLSSVSARATEGF